MESMVSIALLCVAVQRQGHHTIENKMTDKTIIALIKPYDTRFSVFAHGDGGGRTVLEVDWATVLSGERSDRAEEELTENPKFQENELNIKMLLKKPVIRIYAHFEPT
ncbi:hypothetical protein BDV35DRAFT_157265 [Aspergillus flavus]|uniref:Uncharacterized protein n=1 Tax=Aspergillus flavus TaxID=5059 RepID=A0A5N6H339_ASPFL|nr:hypothetical protein BDV35DRAFT_157265 [Aspergillus flavus]